MNKKALATKTLVELIFFAVITLLIALPLLMKMFGFFIGEPDTGTKKSLDALAIEINNLNRETTVPVYVDEAHVIRGYTAQDAKPSGSKCINDKSCLCICSINEEGCGQENREIQCSKLDFNLQDNLMIEPKLVNKQGQIDEDGKAIIQNCLLSIDNNIVTVSCS